MSGTTCQDFFCLVFMWSLWGFRVCGVFVLLQLVWGSQRTLDLPKGWVHGPAGCHVVSSAVAWAWPCWAIFGDKWAREGGILWHYRDLFAAGLTY